MKTKFKNNKGITLIALVITIIVLLILAGVSIAMLTGQNGILTQAQKAKNETENAQVEQNDVLYNYEQYIEGSTNGGTLTKVTGNETTNTTVYDSLKNKVVVPAGFRVVNPGDNVEDGIIIEDVSHQATAGSQFVWIPVGTFKTTTETGEETVILSRYTFDSLGTQTEQGNNVIDSYFQELDTGNGNTAAKDIEGFKTSATTNGGYYIGRYEARTLEPRMASTDDSGLTQVTVKPNDYVYNFVTQTQAAKISEGMYTDGNFESDLMNSYAWDTAVVFLQECDDREGTDNKPYSQQNCLNNSLANKGTNNQTTKDIICNVYDIASNCREWTTESSNHPSLINVTRGGVFGGPTYCTATRHYDNLTVSDNNRSFRPILYL